MRMILRSVCALLASASLAAVFASCTTGSSCSPCASPCPPPDPVSRTLAFRRFKIMNTVGEDIQAPGTKGTTIKQNEPQGAETGLTSPGIPASKSGQVTMGYIHGDPAQPPTMENVFFRDVENIWSVKLTLDAGHGAATSAAWTCGAPISEVWVWYKGWTQGPQGGFYRVDVDLYRVGPTGDPVFATKLQNQMIPTP